MASSPDNNPTKDDQNARNGSKTSVLDKQVHGETPTKSEAHTEPPGEDPTPGVRPGDLGLLLLRVMPLFLLVYGLGKLGNFAGFRQLVSGTSVGAVAPDLVAALQLAAEIALPLALAVGLLTRLSGLLLTLSMGSVWLVVHLLPNAGGAMLTAQGGLRGDTALLFALSGLVLFCTGAGRISLDQVLLRPWLRARSLRRTET